MISVLIAVKTGVEYVSEAVTSVVAQTYHDWEILIGVNGYRPLSMEYCHLKQLEVVPRCHVLDFPGCKNKPQALNALREWSDARHIAILDADDKWHPDKLKKQIPYLWDWDVVGTQGQYIGTSNNFIGTPAGEVTHEMLLEANHVVNSSVVMRRELAVWPDTDGLDDYPMWLELTRRGNRVFNVPEVLTYIRCHEGQWFRNRSDADGIRTKSRQLAGR